MREISVEVMMVNFTTCSNVSMENLNTDKKPTQIVAIVFLSCFPFITIAGNILVIYIVIKSHKFRQKANVFVVSLAVADIAVAIFVMSFSILTQFGSMIWLRYREVCWLSFSLDVMFTSTSILHLMCMTVDRYLAVCLPFKYHSIMHTKTVAGLLFLCWVLPAVYSFCFIFNGFHTIGVEQNEDCLTTCAVRVNIYYAVICSLVAFYIPSVFMLVCNLKIFWRVRQKGRQLCELIRNVKENDKLMKREVKVARTIAILLSCFFFCWLPFFIVNIVDPIIHYKTDQKTWIVIIWLGYINSTINPYLYYFLNNASTIQSCKTFVQKCCRKSTFYKKKNVYVINNLPTCDTTIM